MGLFDFIAKAQQAQKDVDDIIAAETRRAEIELAYQAQQLKIQAMAQNNLTVTYDPAHQHSYTAYANTVNAAQSGLYYGTTTTTAGAATGVGGAVWIGGGGGGATYTQYAPSYPIETGSTMEISFIDAYGVEHTMTVDAGFAGMINHISFRHRAHLANIPKCLPDPDFDLDDMERASELLEGLDGPRPEG